MKILVIHDRAEVADQIVHLIVEMGVPEQDVALASDGVSARAALQQQAFDLAIIDLTLPHIGGVTATDFTVADQLLQELFHTDTLNTPGDLIGLTKDADALARIDNTVGSHLMAVIEEDSLGLWKGRVRDRISYAQKSSRTRQLSLNRHYDYDVAIVTALDSELAPYGEMFDLAELKHFKGAREFLFSDVNGTVRKGIAHAIGRAGQASAAALTQAVVTQFRPSLIIMSGFCGGFSAKTEIGQVIIAESVFDWDYGKWLGVGREAKFVSRPEPIVLRDSASHQVAREIMQDHASLQTAVVPEVQRLSDGRIRSLSLKHGPIASGSAVVAEASIIERIQGLNENMLGVDMEAYGFCCAAKYTPVVRPEFLWVKAVADFADKTKDDKDHAACSFLSAKVAQEILLRRWRFSVAA